MAKETLVAKIRTSLDFTEETKSLLQKFPDEWFARDGGGALLFEFQGQYRQAFISVAEKLIQDFFRELGLPDEVSPKVQILETYRGSLIFEAGVIFVGTVGTTYAILKAIADLPKIADGLEETKKRLKKELHDPFETITRGIVNRATVSGSVTLPKGRLTTLDVSIDARPLRGLTPAPSKTHAVHLSLSASRESVTIENLGDEPLRDIRFGLFASPAERNQWSYGDAYVSIVNILSGKQSTSKPISDFHHASGKALVLDSTNPLFLDCWIQDSSGIYLFQFKIEE